MFEKLNVFRMAHAMATHAGQRQALIAENVAHADTPGYRPRDLQPFAETYATPSGDAGHKATRAGHLFGRSDGAGSRVMEMPASGGPNGNGVTIEDQMLKAVEVKRQHDRAMAIYKSSLTILRTSLGRNG